MLIYFNDYILCVIMYILLKYCILYTYCCIIESQYSLVFLYFPSSTGSIDLDRTIGILLTNPVFVGGFLACFLDNTVPGKQSDAYVCV